MVSDFMLCVRRPGPHHGHPPAPANVARSNIARIRRAGETETAPSEDLEQREGRIHRYKGHAVRKNVARSAGVEALRAADPWAAAFEIVSKACDADARGLTPYWVYSLDGGAAIERYIPILPLSRDCVHRDALKRSLAVYRMVFGQPRQDDLLSYLLERLGADAVRLERELTIDLRPRSE